MSMLEDIRLEVIAAVKDDTEKLINPSDYDACISAALMNYSRYKPLEVEDDISGAGTNQVLLPSGWSPEFSSVLFIEYPIGDFPPNLLDVENYIVIPRAGVVRLSFVLSPTGIVRVTYTMLRSADDIPDIDLHAFCACAASYALEVLANAHTPTGDSTIQADVVNYANKSRDYAARAKRYMQIYKEHMGIKEDDTTTAAAAITDTAQKYPGGAERLTHPRWARRRR